LNIFSVFLHLKDLITHWEYNVSR